MTISSRPCFRISVSRLAGIAIVAAILPLCHPHRVRAAAQAPDDALSQREVDLLRDAAFVPMDRVAVFERILDDRQKEIEQLISKRRGHTDFGTDMHDDLDQFGAIVDELNDNLDEYSRHHRDVRKAIPKLLEATQRWSSTLNAPDKNEAYGVVQRIALDNLKDTRTIAESLQADLDSYFKAHPEAEKQEKKRSGDPHAVRDSDNPE